MSGPAKQIVESIPSGDKNYDDAVKLLSEAFSCKVTQQYSVIEKLVSLKLTQPKDAYKWFSEAKILINQIERLNIDSRVFAQYFVWRGLSDHFKSHFIAAINKSKPGVR